MGRLGIGEILFIALVIIVLFGARKLPEIGEALGKALREFKKATKDAESNFKEALNDKDDARKSS